MCFELGLMRFPQAAFEMNLLKVFFPLHFCVKRCEILEKLSRSEVKLYYTEVLIYVQVYHMIYSAL